MVKMTNLFHFDKTDWKAFHAFMLTKCPGYQKVIDKEERLYRAKQAMLRQKAM